MKNLRDFPKNIYFSKLLSDISNIDATTDTSISSRGYTNITFSLSDLYNNYNKSIVYRFTPQQNSNTYNEFYKYNTHLSNDIISFIDIKNEYPLESQFPDIHTNQIGNDGTVSINMKNYQVEDLNIELYQNQNTVPKEWQEEDQYHYIVTLHYLQETEISNGYRIVNNSSPNDYNVLANKYSYYVFSNLFTPVSLPEFDSGFYNIETSSLKNHINMYNDENLYIYYKLVDTKELVKNNEIFEQEISYSFNSQKQINTIKGYLFNFKQYPKYGFLKNTSYGNIYGTFNYLNCDTSYFSNNYIPDQDHYDEVLLTVYSFNETINEQIPIGSRNMFSPDVIDIEKAISIIPTYTSKIKLVIQQKYTFDGIDIDSTSALSNIIFRNINGEVINAKYGSGFNTNNLQFKRCAACSKFLPGFDVELLKNNKGQYHDQQDTRTFGKFKFHETNIKNTEFLTESLKLQNNDYYHYLYNVKLDQTNIEFYLNPNIYKHSDILANGIENIKIDLFTYDYSNIENFNDTTIIESYTINDIYNKISVDFTNIPSELNSNFINIKLNYNQNIEKIISSLNKLNYYTNVYNNYEYNFLIPQIQNINYINKILTYEYDQDSTIVKEINKPLSNYIFINKNINSFYIDNTGGPENIFIQLSEISDGTIINELQFDETANYNYFDQNNYININTEKKLIELNDFTANELTEYIMIFITNNNMQQNNNFDYSKTAKYNLSYTIPISYNVHYINDILSAIDIIKNENIFAYKLQYIKKV